MTAVRRIVLVEHPIAHSWAYSPSLLQAVEPWSYFQRLAQRLADRRIGPPLESADFGKISLDLTPPLESADMPAVACIYQDGTVEVKRNVGEESACMFITERISQPALTA